MIRATVVYSFVGLYLILMAPIGIAWTLAAKESVFIYRLARFCIRFAGWMCRIKVEIHGREKIVPGKAYLFLSNHQGNFDGPVLLHAIPRDIRGLMKMELMKIPVLSWVFRTVQFVPIDRRDSVRARAAIDRGAELMRSGLSFIAFPEGTRSRDGRLKEFKKGAFIMALKASVPIVPITILNTASIQPPGSYKIRPATVELFFHDPIPTEGRSFEDRSLLAHQTRTAIASKMPDES
jgi:1-acyl-sn-glycerol-3-phosphate acyltransferase